VRPEDLRRFAARPWDEKSELLGRFWAEQKRREGPALGLAVAEALYQQMRARRPDWPSDEERQADLATHARVAAALRHVALLHR
jgi:hypothetical protein